MKKIKLFYGILIGLILFSSFKSENKVISNSIIGTWKPIKEVDVCETGGEDSYYYNSCEKKTRIVFFENGNFNMNVYVETDEGCESGSGSRTYSLNGKKITMGNEEGSQTDIILKLTKDVLRIGIDYTKEKRVPSCVDNKGYLQGLSYHYIEYKRVK